MIEFNEFRPKPGRAHLFVNRIRRIYRISPSIKTRPSAFERLHCIRAD
jgi:hypothetical protein